MSITAIIQARMSSRRLPGKVRYPILTEKPMLGWVIERARLIPDVEHVAVATSGDPSDDWVENYCLGSEVDCVRGAGRIEDVLSRYDQAARQLRLNDGDWIVRITGDCPALDPNISSRVIQIALQNRVDYASNLRDWPDGLDTEVFTRLALKEAARMATSEEDREHVTPWMRRNLFCLELPHEPNLRHLKWSVDTEEDLEYVRELYAGLGPVFGWREILAVQPSAVCDGCAAGVPHLQRAGVTVWDLHATRPDWTECRARMIHERAVGIPRVTVGVPFPGGATRRSQDAVPAAPGDASNR